MTLGIAIAGLVATVVAGLGGAYIGAKLQRSGNLAQLQIELQIDAAAKFLAAASDFQFIYGVQWAPGTEDLTLTERHAPILNALLSVRTQSASVGIAGPDELALTADHFVELAQEGGLTTVFDVGLVKQLATLTYKFIDGAKRLRVDVGQKNGRKRLRRPSHPKPPRGELPAQ